LLVVLVKMNNLQKKRHKLIKIFVREFLRLLIFIGGTGILSLIISYTLIFINKPEWAEVGVKIFSIGFVFYSLSILRSLMIRTNKNK